MSSASKVPELGPGARTLLSWKLGSALTPYAAVATLAKSMLTGKVNTSDAAKPLVETLRATKTSPASTVFFFFLVAITLGIYLLWTLCLTKVILQDGSSFYYQALAAIKKMANPEPPTNITFPKDWMNPELQAAENSFEESCRQVFESLEEPLLLLDSKYEFHQFSNAYELVQTTARAHEGKLLALKKVATLFAEKGEMNFEGKLATLFDARTMSRYVIKGGGLKIKDGVSSAQWNAFVVKFLQLEEIHRELWKLDKSVHSERRKFIHGKITGATSYSMGGDILSMSFAKKISSSFMEALDGALKVPPLNQIFARKTSNFRDDAILLFLWTYGTHFVTALKGGLQHACEQSFPIIIRHNAFSSTFIDTAIGDSYICSHLGLEIVNEEFHFNSEKCKIELGKEANRVMKRLLSCLDECLRRYLLETTFSFSYGSPARMEEVTFPQLYERCAAEWDAVTESGQSETNGVLFARAEAAVADLRREFLAEITEDGVEEYRRKLVAASVP